MKRKIISALTAAVITAAGALDLCSFAAGDITFDFDGDGRLSVYDLIIARQKGESAEDLGLLQDFLLGKDPDFPGKPDVPSGVVIDESCILEPKGTVHTGDGTYYGGGYEGGCAMLDPVDPRYYVVAMNLADYNNAQLAGAYIQVTGELGTINMLVTDLLPEGKKGDLDLHVDAFPLVAPAIKGRVPVSWKIIPLDTAENAPVSYRYKEGTTRFWCGVQVLNHRYPITRLEYLDENGVYQELPRRHYNYFESDKMGAGPFTFRITDIYGQVIVDEGIPLSTDYSEVIQGHVQFPE